MDQKKLVDELKTEWKKLWEERFDDKIRAEGIAKNDYLMLYVDRGTIIHATRDYKAINFKDILEQHEVENEERYLPLNPTVGGWNKFIKSQITKQPQVRIKRADLYRQEKIKKQQTKKSGRGWLHK